MNTTRRLLLVLLLASFSAAAASHSPDTDWLKDARYGVFTHYLPGDRDSFSRVKDFDAEGLARQLESMGAGYLVFTLGQNSGFFNAPNSVYGRVTGYDAGERCARRDLPADLHQVLKRRGIRLLLYLPCQVPNQDARAQRAFGLAEGPKDQPLSLEFAEKWAAVIREWSDRYGDKVSGWWFDGGYEHIGFNESIAGVYAAAVKHGNPKAIVTFNPGVKMIRHTQAEDYTAGELNDPFGQVPTSRWLEGSQWHALTYMGSSWGRRDTRHAARDWAAWAGAVVSGGGVVTFDMGPNMDPGQGPIGLLAEAQVAQVKEVRAGLAGLPGAGKEVLPARLKRSESFLGVHFDFHAGPDCTEVGKNTTRGMIEKVIRQVRPDYIQIDCKGHAGFSSYPTRVGNRAPGFVGDPLRLWREVTAEHGVSLYMHYSGVWDSEAIRRNPGWGVINADGATNGNATSFFSAYADQLLIPQLRELAGDYGVDGAWVDGECWASMPDYGEAARGAFAKATGWGEVPRKPGEPHWYEWLEFNREAYRGYLRHYVAEVKRTHPAMELCSNWAFTDHMPEAVSAPVDWISGDYSPEDSLNSARFSARYMAGQGKPWDLMAWSFTTKPGKDGSNRKSVPQLQREAAAVLSMGGGFQAYFTQKRDGSVREEQLPVMGEVARFCRERQPFAHRAEVVPQVALLYSTASHYREVNGLFSRDLSRLRGTLQALLEVQQSVEVVGEHNLRGRMGRYPLIVVPELVYLEPEFRRELVTYVRGGGNLLLIGPRTAGLFAAELGVSLEGSAQPATCYLSHLGRTVPVRDEVQSVRPGGVRSIGELCPTPDAGAGMQPASTIAALGRGRIAATYFSFSRGYLGDRSEVSRGFLGDVVGELFPRPLVRVKGSADVDVSVTRVMGQLAVQLVNTSGPHADGQSPIHDRVEAVGPLEVRVRAGSKPRSVVMEPGGRRLAFEYEAGEVRVTVPSLDIHRVLLVE